MHRIHLGKMNLKLTSWFLELFPQIVTDKAAVQQRSWADVLLERL